MEKDQWGWLAVGPLNLWALGIVIVLAVSLDGDVPILSQSCCFEPSHTKGRIKHMAENDVAYG